MGKQVFLRTYQVLLCIWFFFFKIVTLGANAPKCVKRFSLEEFGEKCHDVVMWIFFCCLRESRGEGFLTAQKYKRFVQKLNKNDQTQNMFKIS